ncbi:MAG: zinc ribbon domain-containing protein [Clostridia bacterium]|nr:zinc ribbon domain-containing protein [Clostridia bacterium]
MICPRCQNPVQENERFCSVCGLQLPESQPQQPAAPQYVPASPASSAVMNPSYSAVTIQPQTKRRPFVLGIVGFALSFSAIALGFFAIYFAGFTDLMDMYDLEMDAVYENLFYSYSTIYALMALVMGVVSAVFGGVAVNKLNSEPERYMGKGMYITAIVLGSIGAVFALLAFVF